MKFFSPTSEYKELLLLEHIEKNSSTSQHEIARKIGSAVSMVNVYINKLEESGYLIRDYQSAKIVYYNITPKGIKRKNFLSITYFYELLDLYRLAEQNIEVFLEKLEERGYRNILFYGSEEVAETILGILKEKSDTLLKIVALVDDNKDRQGKELLGYKIISREEIKKFEHDGIVITSYTFEDDIKNKLEEIDYPKNHVELFFSGM